MVQKHQVSISLPVLDGSNHLQSHNIDVLFGSTCLPQKFINNVFFNRLSCVAECMDVLHVIDKHVTDNGDIAYYFFH